MLDPDRLVLFPAYAADLRLLINGAWSDEPLPQELLPGGAISERVSAPELGPGPLVYAESGPSPDPEAGYHKVPLVDYLERAIGHRTFLIGPLLSAADADPPIPDLHAAERRLLALYYWRYGRTPLSPQLLALIRRAHGADRHAGLLQWLDKARSRVVVARTVSTALYERYLLRLEALRLGAAGAWQDLTLSVAELLVDVLVLHRAVAHDVRAAWISSRASRRSILVELGELDQRAALEFESLIPQLVRVTKPVPELDPAEKAMLVSFGRARMPRWREGLLAPRHSPAGPSAQAPVLSPRISPTPTPAPPEATGAPEPTARESYQRIRRELERKIIGHDVRRLALIGVAHLHGVMQRVLISGASGSGKTHCATALAESLGRPFFYQDLDQVTATGFKGIDTFDLLDALARQNGGSLDGAVIQVDEVDKCRIGKGAEGSTLESKLNVQTALLGLLDGRPVTTETITSRQIQTKKILIVGTGAFENRFVHTPPTTRDLVQWGWIPEFAARWTDRICLAPLDRVHAIDLLRRSERSVASRLGPLLKALGISVTVPDQVHAYVAELWIGSHADFRTASEWILEAARRRLLDVLESDVDEITLTPDDISAVRRRAPDLDR